MQKTTTATLFPGLISTLPTQGNVVISPDNTPATSKTISYTPNSNAKGVDTIVVAIADETGEGSKVTLDINFIPPSYKVSLTVSGYTTGNTLVLQNNWGDDLSLTGDGVYEFESSIERGKTYEVSLTSPTSVIKTSCQLNNASGTIENSNISDVTLICNDTVLPYVISHSPAADAVEVSTDTEISVVFDENMLPASIGSDAIEIFSTSLLVSGAVSFDDLSRTISLDLPSLEFNQSYTAVLSSNISDLSGQLYKGSSWSFTTRDAAWGKTEKFMTLLPGDSINNSIVVDSLGNGLSVWNEFDGAQYHVFEKRLDVNADNWSDARNIFSSSSAIDLVKAITIGSGDVIIIWDQIVALDREIWFMYYDSGINDWSAANKINAPNYIIKSHQAGLNILGQGIVKWRSFDGVQNQNWFSYFDWPSKSWTTVKQILPGTSEFLINPAEALNVLSEPLVLWEEGLFAQEVYIAMNYDRSRRVWGNAEVIVNKSKVSGRAWSVTNTRGDGIVLWFEDDISEYSLWIKRYDWSAKTWRAAEKIEVINPKPNFIGRVEVALDGKGRGLLVMELRDQGIFPGAIDIRIWGKRIELNGNKIGTAKLIENSEGYARTPQVVVNSVGEGIAAWRQHDGKRHNVWANRFDVNTNSWGEPELLENLNQGPAFPPGISINRLGRGLAIWRQKDDSGDHLWSSRLK